MDQIQLVRLLIIVVDLYWRVVDAQIVHAHCAFSIVQAESELQSVAVVLAEQVNRVIAQIVVERLVNYVAAI